jgi:hypothetical protein
MSSLKDSSRPAMSDLDTSDDYSLPPSIEPKDDFLAGEDAVAEHASNDSSEDQYPQGWKFIVFGVAVLSTIFLMALDQVRT